MEGTVQKTGLLSAEEQQRFSSIILKALNEVLSVLDDVTNSLISQQRWDELQEIHSCVQHVRMCVGVPGCWERASADKTIADFYEKCKVSPRLSTCQEILMSWDHLPGTESPPHVIQQFLEGCNRKLSVINSALVQEQQWALLAKLSDSLALEIRQIMADHEQERLYLHNLKRMGCFGGGPELDAALSTFV